MNEFEAFVEQNCLSLAWQEVILYEIKHANQDRPSCAFLPSGKRDFSQDTAVFIDWFVFRETCKGEGYWFGLVDFFEEASVFERQIFFSTTHPNDFPS